MYRLLILYTTDMNIVVLDSKHWPEMHKNGVREHDVREVAEKAASEVTEIISFVPSYVNLVLYPVTKDEAIPETGGGGMTYTDEYASVYFDYNLPYGKKALYKELRSTVYHELVHAVTFQYESWQSSAVYGAVTEGLASVFERDYAKNRVLWSDYEDDITMKKWLQELKDLSDDGQKNHDYFYSHPDGRRWIAYKTGTWIIDKLLADGEDLFELMKLKHTDVLAKFDKLDT